MEMFMMLCGTPLLAMAIIGVPVYILFNIEEVIKWFKE